MSLSCSNDISNQCGMKEDTLKKAGPPKQSVYCGSAAVGEGEAVAAAPADLRQEGSNGENALMKRTLVAQSRKIQQLTAKTEAMETERETLRQEIDALRMTVFEASTRAEQTAEQCKQSAVDAAVREIARDREAFTEGRREALKRIAELEDALEIALRAAGGVHKRLLELGLSCEDLGKTSVHLSVAAKEAPAQDKPALAVAGETIEAVVGVMRAMEGSGVFDILDPLEDEVEDDVSTLEAAAATEAESAQQPGDTSNKSPFLPERKNSTVNTPAKPRNGTSGSGVPTVGLANNDGVERGSVVNPEEEDAASSSGKKGKTALEGGVFNEGRTGDGESRGVSEGIDRTRNSFLDSRRA